MEGCTNGEVYRTRNVQLYIEEHIHKKKKKYGKEIESKGEML